MERSAVLGLGVIIEPDVERNHLFGESFKHRCVGAKLGHPEFRHVSHERADDLRVRVHRVAVSTDDDRVERDTLPVALGHERGKETDRRDCRDISERSWRSDQRCGHPAKVLGTAIQREVIFAIKGNPEFGDLGDRAQSIYRVGRDREDVRARVSLGPLLRLRQHTRVSSAVRRSARRVTTPATVPRHRPHGNAPFVPDPTS